MSLLLDALKRAEQEKRARQPAGSPPPAASVRPAASAASALELQPIAPATSAAAHARAAQAANASGVRVEPAQAAQNVFQAKATDPDSPRNRTVLWLMFGAIALVAIAAAAYVWYSVKSFTPQYAGAPRPRPAPTPPPASGSPLPPQASMGSIVPAPGMPTEPPALSPELSASNPGAVGSAPRNALEPSTGATVAMVSPAPAARAPAPIQESPGERLERAAAESAARAPPPLRMDRAPDAGRRVPAGVSAGYEALRQGDYVAARRGYEAALSADPASVDAHLGMATLAARSANRGAAADHYRRALDLDPRNATALAGLAALADFSRPDGLEEQLRADIARHPESAALHFTLGNLFASQGRWNEAQSAYFEAHRRDPGSADVAYNLAVALDHLGQRRLAADFYARALEGARERGAQFDPAGAGRRLQELR